MIAIVQGAHFHEYGWGHGVTGGACEGRQKVTRFGDDVKKPLPGMLRWVEKQKEQRVFRYVT